MFFSNFREIWEVILGGGPLMIALALLGFMLYRNALSLLIFVVGINVKEACIASCDTLTRNTVIAFRKKFKEVVKSQMKYANVLIVAAPLLGLLGTVIGMLDTFRGIGAEAGEDTTRAVADGVKVALITTQTGLAIAIFGMIIIQMVSLIYRKKNLKLVDIELETMKRGIQS